MSKTILYYLAYTTCTYHSTGQQRRSRKTKTITNALDVCLCTFSFAAASAPVGRSARTPPGNYTRECVAIRTAAVSWVQTDVVALQENGNVVVPSSGGGERGRPSRHQIDGHPKRRRRCHARATTVVLLSLSRGGCARADGHHTHCWHDLAPTARVAHDAAAAAAKTRSEDPALSDLLGKRSGYISAGGRTRDATFIRRARRVSTGAARRGAATHAADPPTAGGHGRTRTPPLPHVRVRCFHVYCVQYL